MVIILVVIHGYYISGYSWLFYWWVLVGILLMAISDYFIDGYWWLFY